MITRRAFLIGAGSALTLSIVDKFVWHLDNKGKPLIEKPKDTGKVLFVHGDDDYRIDLGRTPEKFPTVTWREFLVEKLGHPNPTTLSQFREIYYNYDIKPRDLDTECDSYFGYWDQNESPTALAYNLLDGLDIGPVLKGPGDEVGGLEFIDGDAPGHDYLGVHADDDLSISLLQHRLNELGTGIAVEFVPFRQAVWSPRPRTVRSPIWMALFVGA
jgi:hypothetical protein